jgi:hypothetical protein
MRSRLPLSPLPPVSTLAEVFGIGATVGPIVDSLHNQCLLQYDYAPITIPFPIVSKIGPSWVETFATATAHDNLFCSSWIVPPLLGMAYIILGVIMPRLVLLLLHGADTDHVEPFQITSSSNQNETWVTLSLRQKAILAIATTSILILFSAFLETLYQEQLYQQQDQITLFDHAAAAKQVEQGLLTVLAVLQWAWLDTSRSSFLIGILAYIGGPLCELPFCGHGIWHYLPQASDYVPMASLLPTTVNPTIYMFLSWILGSDHIQDLSLSSITGPCYFAVTTDAIAVARWLEASHLEEHPK